MIKKLARIERVDFGFEDHGLFSLNIAFDLAEGGHQGTGHYSLDNWYGGPYLTKVHKVLGITSLDQAVGKAVQLYYNDNSNNAQIKGFELAFDKKDTLLFDVYAAAIKRVVQVEAKSW